MELASHILIGRLIADAFSFEGLCRKAFLFGCIEPDCVMVTYLRGAHRGTGLHGHCWNNIQSCISSLIEKCAGEVGVLAAFRLGKLCHYIVDAFTFPHNSDFSGTLSEHMAYEDDLTLYLIKNKQNMRFSPNRFSFSFRWIESLHEEYMAEKPSMSRDAYYALSASFAAAYALIGYEGDIVLA